ncbi:MAG: thiazole synthase, partial [Chloroflexota bacterium]|nr:thiazole synthase [Chloroflexota bacterium]
KQLIKEGFVVLPYIHADPILARKLEEIGCATVMPLGSAIGSGQGIHTADEVRIIIESANVPVVVDAGLGVPSDASEALEMGAQAVLVNTAIAQAKDPVLMAESFKLGVEAGRKAYLAGRIPRKAYAQASSPTADVPQATRAAR